MTKEYFFDTKKVVNERGKRTLCLCLKKCVEQIIADREMYVEHVFHPKEKTVIAELNRISDELTEILKHADQELSQVSVMQYFKMLATYTSSLEAQSEESEELLPLARVMRSVRAELEGYRIGYYFIQEKYYTAESPPLRAQNSASASALYCRPS